MALRRAHNNQPKTQIDNMPTKSTAKLKAQKASSSATCYAKYTDYIKNAGGQPLVAWFDDDWSPIGPQVRQSMTDAGLIREIEGRLYLA